MEAPWDSPSSKCVYSWVSQPGVQGPDGGEWRAGMSSCGSLCHGGGWEESNQDLVTHRAQTTGQSGPCRDAMRCARKAWVSGGMLLMEACKT